MTFKPAMPDFPDDFLAWATTLKHKYFHSHRPNRRMYTFTLARPLISRYNMQPVVSSFTLIPEHILQSPDWRRDVAQRIRDLKVACRRQVEPKPKSQQQM